MVATTLLVAGSTRVTVLPPVLPPLPRLSVHTPPSPTARRPGFGPTSMVSTIWLLCGFTRVEAVARLARDPQRVVAEHHRVGAAGDVDLGDRRVGVWIDPRHHALAIGDRPDAADAGGNAAIALSHCRSSGWRSPSTPWRPRARWRRHHRAAPRCCQRPRPATRTAGCRPRPARRACCPWLRCASRCRRRGSASTRHRQTRRRPAPGRPARSRRRSTARTGCRPADAAWAWRLARPKTALSCPGRH